MDINSISAASLPAASARTKPQVVRADAEAELRGQPQQKVGQQQQPAEAKASSDPTDIQDAVSSIQQFVQTVQRNLNFSLDDSSGRVVVKVTDGASGELIRQIPSEEALRLAESLDQARSLLFKAEA